MYNCTIHVSVFCKLVQLCICITIWGILMSFSTLLQLLIWLFDSYYCRRLDCYTTFGTESFLKWNLHWVKERSQNLIKSICSCPNDRNYAICCKNTQNLKRTCLHTQETLKLNWKTIYKSRRGLIPQKKLKKNPVPKLPFFRDTDAATLIDIDELCTLHWISYASL